MHGSASNGTLRERALRRVSGGVALLFSLAQLLSTAHLLFVPHVVCPEHGEFMHGGDHVRHGAGLASAELGPGSRQTRSWTRTGSSELSSADAHEHCVVSTGRREQPAVLGAVASRVDACNLPLMAARVDGILALRSIAILHFAPKSSPPTAA